MPPTVGAVLPVLMTRIFGGDVSDSEGVSEGAAKVVIKAEFWGGMSDSEMALALAVHEGNACNRDHP